MNVWDFVLAAAIAALLVFAVWLMLRSRSKGGCASCPYAENCADVNREQVRRPSPEMRSRSPRDCPERAQKGYSSLGFRG